MNLLSIENLTKSYSDKLLFRDISFGINEGDRVALIAPNGTGKTTLINILKGLEIPDKGKAIFRNDLRIAFLDQLPVIDENKSVLDSVLFAGSQITSTIAAYEAALEDYTHDQSDKHMKQLHHATAAMDDQGAWDYEQKVKQVLTELGLVDVTQLAGSLSGGQRKRLALASVLLQQADLLILDEPTNHLDLEMIEWLEDYIVSNDLSLLLVTHDRYFLDSVCNKIIELDQAKLHFYSGNFEYFMEKKAERGLAEIADSERTRNLYKRELEWVRRMPKARTTKSKSRVDAFYKIEEKAHQYHQEQQIKLSVKMSRMGGKILELHNVTKAYDDLLLIKDFSYDFRKGEKIGIVGKNGIGKSTLLNIIMDLVPADTGKVVSGETIIFGYYNQSGMVVGEDKRVIEVVTDIADFIPMADGSMISASSLLSQFNFPPAQQYSMVSKLSGGERRRLYLLTLLMKNPNFLILDEPTNDLDIPTLQILEDFLNDFKGCVIIISHDRYFLDKLADQLFIFEGNGKIRVYAGNYTEYRLERMEEDEKKRKAELKISETASTKNTSSTEVKKKLSFKEKTELENLDRDIKKLEEEKIALETKMNNGITDHTELSKTAKRIAEIIQLLDVKSMRWLELSGD